MAVGDKGLRPPTYAEALALHEQGMELLRQAGVAAGGPGPSAGDRYLMAGAAALFAGAQSASLLRLTAPVHLSISPATAPLV
jgi:hypothetical protein